MKIVAVTSCPTGIAHTYMAAESLSKAARERGHSIRIETQGSTGIEDTISPEQVAEADAVIFAADAAVQNRERFEGKPLIEVPSAKAINRPAEVLDAAEQAAKERAEGGTFEAAPARTEVERTEATPAGKPVTMEPRGATSGSTGVPARSAKGGTVRQWLMTGVSYMIPFVTAGGIMIALAFLLGDTIEVVESNVYENFTIPALLIEIGGTAFSMLVPILAGFIAYAMADRPGIAPGIVGGLLAVETEAGFLGGLIAGLLAGGIVMALKKLPIPAGLRGLMPVLVLPLLGTLIVGTLMILVVGEPIAALTVRLESFLSGLEGGNIVFLGIILGAMMAFDMGGPVNKVAYTFAIGAVAAEILRPMAIVMAAGMTPPLGLALATVLRRNLFDREEREAGKASWVMGASFITEGAIPFAAADPLRVIPAIIVGSATAGGLAAAFGNDLRAPHGGVFVIGLVDNWPLYILAIAAGTVVTAVLVVVLKSIGRSREEAAASETADTTEGTPAHA